MKYADALKESEKCVHAVPVFTIDMATSASCANACATIVCKLKARRGEVRNMCDEREGTRCYALPKA